MRLPKALPEDVGALTDLEHKAECEWWWLNGALHAVAQVQAEGLECVPEMREQQRNIDRVRLEISVRLAALARR
jgi:hypothetical protein